MMSEDKVCIFSTFTLQYARTSFIDFYSTLTMTRYDDDVDILRAHLVLSYFTGARRSLTETK